MFDIGFMELLLIGIVALLVLGPEKMPGAIRTGALWIGRARRSFNKVKLEIEQQINADEIRRQLHNESILSDIERARNNADKLLKDTQKELQQAGSQVKEAGDDLTQSIKDIKDIPVFTSSAQEGAIPDPTDTAPVTASESAELPREHTEPAATAGETSATEAAQSSLSQSDEMPGSATGQPPRKKAPVQDFYNTPPTGRVTLQDGQLTMADESPAEPNPDQKA